MKYRAYITLRVLLCLLPIMVSRVAAHHNATSIFYSRRFSYQTDRLLLLNVQSTMTVIHYPSDSIIKSGRVYGSSIAVTTGEKMTKQMYIVMSFGSLLLAEKYC